MYIEELPSDLIEKEVSTSRYVICGTLFVLYISQLYPDIDLTYVPLMCWYFNHVGTRLVLLVVSLSYVFGICAAISSNNTNMNCVKYFLMSFV